ncbi:uncharacterized protein [Rutidosis leptorrhynchoides]|uniref:uncharacterized protein n=1 Tax=Rutidosis leptorrhynchoides TaxID=125765 RepID=UPI003A991396
MASLNSINLALLYKWRWRFLRSQDDPWVKLLNVIHGESSGGVLPCHKYASGTWASITKCVDNLHNTNIIAASRMKICVGNGLRTKFWHDPFHEGTPLVTSFNRQYALDVNKNCSVADRISGNGPVWSWRRNPRGGVELEQLQRLENIMGQASFTSDQDQWTWANINSNVYSVSHARFLVDIPDTIPSLRPTAWCRYVPIKFNVFIWRLLALCLPTRMNLLERGIACNNTMCGIFGVDSEDEVHLFLNYQTSKSIWCFIARWTNLNTPSWSSIEGIWTWVDGVPISNLRRIILRFIVISTLWTIWRLRNSIIFKDNNFRKCHVLNNIKVTSFNCLFSRFHKSRVNWSVWLQNPMTAL